MSSFCRRKILETGGAFSEEGQPAGNPADGKETTPYGKADVTTSLIEFPQAGVTLGLKMGRIAKEGVVLVQPFLKNTGTRPIKLIGLQNLAASAAGQALTLTGKPGQWIVTPLDHSKENPAFTLDTVSAAGTTIREVGIT